MPRVAAVVSLLFAVFAPAAQAAPGDIIVQRDPGLTRSERAAIRADADVRLVRTLPIDRTEVVEPQAGQTVGAALSELRADADVVYAEVDRPAHVETADTFWNSLWGLEQSSDADIDAAEAWAKSSGAGVTVGVVDTGVLFSHTDLAGQLAGNPGEQGAGRESNGVDDDHNGLVDDFQGWDFVYDDNTPEDGHGHGTHVSGTIAAVENTTGVVGVAPAAKVMPIRALDETGSGSMSGVAAAFSYAGDQGLPVVNASLGGGYSTTVHDAIASHPDTLYVVAAGNDAADDDDPNLADYPCAYDLANIVCVGATDRYDEPATFSNYGRTSVDLSAPGVGIISTWNTGTTAYKSLQGTSMATPHVAGAAALALAAQPAASTAQVRSALLSSVDVKPSLSGLSVTGGRLNADAAVDAMLGVAPDPAPTGTPTPTPPVSTPPPPPVEAPVTTPTPPVSAPVTPAPVLRHVTIVRRHGKLRVTFSLSRAASVRLTVARRGTARAARSWTVRGRAGANSCSLTGRVPRRAGAYTLSVRLDAAVASAGFKVTR